MTPKSRILPVLLQALVLAACGAGDQSGDTRSAADGPRAEPPAADATSTEPPADAVAGGESPAADERGAEPARTSPGKPTAPITIDYEVIGTPVVGQPVSINLNVASSVPDTPVTLSYRINDASTLAFPEAQARRVPLGSLGGGQHASQQVTVMPQREGRLYLNVSAEIDTGDGTLLKSIAIPIQVGTTPGGRATNGEIVRDADGEPVISLPADDR